MNMRALLLVAAVAAPLAACETGGYYPMPQPYPGGGGYNPGYPGTPDYGQQPNYGSTNLVAGFTPDPRIVNLSSGGSIDASQTVGSGCRGYITSAPDYRVNYQAGGYPLIISVASNTDTTLVINGPNGQYTCDDDSGNGTNPSVRFNNPQSGQYDIWVGTYGSASSAPASLYISEVSSQ